MYRVDRLAKYSFASQNTISTRSALAACGDRVGALKKSRVRASSP